MGLSRLLVSVFATFAGLNPFQHLTFHCFRQPVSHFLHHTAHGHLAIQQQLFHNQLPRVTVEGLGGVDVPGIAEDPQHSAALGFVLHHTSLLQLVRHQVVLDKDTERLPNLWEGRKHLEDRPSGSLCSV